MSLRRRIRRLQRWRGIWTVLATFLGGLCVIMALNVFFSPISLELRWGMLAGWIIAVTFMGFRHLIRPLAQKISLQQIARWLEIRHPEVEERISTALHFSKEAEGVSPEIIEKLCLAATADVQDFEPKTEVRNQSVRRSFIPAVVLLSVLLVSLVIWPAQVGRLLLRSVAPFTSAGNIGAINFEISPGDLEVLEGDEVLIDFTYEGDLGDGLALVTEARKGGRGMETLKPVKSEDDKHQFQYRLVEADQSFTYFARVGSHESDRFDVTVWPKPRLQNVRVTYDYPTYATLPGREAELGSGLKALVGTKVTLKGKLNTPVESAVFEHGSKTEQVSVETSSGGGSVSWSWTVKSDDAAFAKLMLKHRLGKEFEGLHFSVQPEEDAAPVVTIQSPLQRQLRMRPDDQIILNYEVVEKIGLAAAEIEIEVDGQSQPALKELLPERILGDPNDRWKGEAMVYVGGLLDRFEQARHFRLRLKLSDNRPVDLDGPGIGYSEWLEVTLDDKAPSLVRQELRMQHADLKKSLEQAQRDIREARQKMYQAKPHLEKETTPSKAQKALAKGREKLAAAEQDLKALVQRMKDGVQAHRGNEVLDAMFKVSQARESLQNAPLQDTWESRRSEMDSALRESDEALKKLQKLRDEVDRDRHKVEQLAHLEELAQRQGNLADKSLEAIDGEQWKRDQKRVRDEVRQTLKKSPKAIAAALREEGERAAQLAQEAEELSRTQAQLQQLAQNENQNLEGLREQLQKQQEEVTSQVESALVKARQDQNPQANELAEALAKSQDTVKDLNSETSKAAAESLKAARAEKELVERQSEIAKSLAAMEKGKPEQALAIIQNQEASDAEQFANEVKTSPNAEGRKGEMIQAAKQSSEGARKARQASAKLTQGDQKQAAQRNEQASKKFQETAGALKQAAQQAEQRAKQLSRQEQGGDELSLPAKPMAEAFRESSEAAAAPKTSSAKQSAQAAASSLKRVAQRARQALAQGRSANEPEQAMPNDEPGDPGKESGDKPREGIQKEQADEGVPPNLAKLGISAEDWEKIKASMNSDVSAPGGSTIPEDYRGLTQKYFQQLTKEK